MTIKIILKDTQLAENVGMVARVMLNFKLLELMLVSPFDNARNLENAMPASCQALENMHVKIYDKMEEVLVDTNTIYAFSARKRYLRIPQISIHEMFNDQFFQSSNRAILFGGEKSGLSNADISYANYLVYIPTNESFPSLNLAQAVGLFAYEFDKHMVTNRFKNYEMQHNQSNNQNPNSSSADSPNFTSNNNLVDLAKLNFFYEDLFDKLTKKNFFSNPQKAQITKQNIKLLYAKLNLTNQELDTLIAINKMLYGKNT